LSVSIVVPCYRSSATLPTLVARLNGIMLQVAQSYELILVVDGSPDDTWDVARDLAEGHPWVRALRFSRNYGQHNAVVAGVRAARYDVVVTMDDDLRHPPEEIPKLLAALTDDLDLVYGLAQEEERHSLRSVVSRLVKAGVAGTMGVQNAKLLSAFRVFRTFLRRGFDQIHGPHASVDVALSWATTRVGAVTVRMDGRKTDRSGHTFRRLVNHAIDMLLGPSTTPMRFVTYFGFLVGFAGLALFGRLSWLYFGGVTNVAGFTTVVSVVTIFSSAQLIAIGVLGEYIGRIYAGGMGRPTFVIRERVEEGLLSDLPDDARRSVAVPGWAMRPAARR